MRIIKRDMIQNKMNLHTCSFSIF